MGIDFLDKVKTIIIPHARIVFIMDNGQAYAIPKKGKI